MTIDQWVAQGCSKHPRTRRGKYTYRALAKLSGVSYSTVVRLAKGKHKAHKSTALAIRDASGGQISWTWLTGVQVDCD